MPTYSTLASNVPYYVSAIFACFTGYHLSLGQGDWTSGLDLIMSLCYNQGMIRYLYACSLTPYLVANVKRKCLVYMGSSPIIWGTAKPFKLQIYMYNKSKTTCPGYHLTYELWKIDWDLILRNRGMSPLTWKLRQYLGWSCSTCGQLIFICRV